MPVNDYLSSGSAMLLSNLQNGRAGHSAALPQRTPVLCGNAHRLMCLSKLVLLHERVKLNLGQNRRDSDLID